MAQTFFDKLEQHLQKKLPFVAYRKPEEQMLHAMYQANDTLEELTASTNSGFVLAPFNSAHSKVLIVPKEKDSSVYTRSSIDTPENFNRVLARPNAAAKLQYTNNVIKAIQQIKAGAMEKVVLSHKIAVDTTKDPIVIFKEMLDRYSNAFCYLWYHPKIGLWLGATPELLLHVSNQRLTTMSLAGTQPYKEGIIPGWKAKEIQEQQLVTSYISDILKDKLQDMQVSDRSSIRAGNLWHLQHQFSGKLNNAVTVAEIVAALHPTPAVCGLPKQAARDFIETHELYDRAYYTGFLGVLHQKEQKSRAKNNTNVEHLAYRAIKNTSSLYVNLRCMQITENKAYIYVGGGITASSDPQKEWQETLNQSATMLNLLN